ncbi:MAG: dienelactone hydrolase family protein [Gemmataceae bacterium]
MRTLATVLVTLLWAGWLQAAVHTETVSYQHEGVTLNGHLAYDDAVSGKRPGILVVHEFWGLNDYAKKRAEQLAQMGYVAFACDMYGEGKSFEHPKEAGEMMGKMRENIALWQGRAKASLAVLQKNDRVDPKKIGAIGYCFGGATVLQLAYLGADVNAVVSFHGALPVATAGQAKNIKAKILICHGADDAHIKIEDVEKFRAPLKDAKVDYQINIYGGATHSFTVPGVDQRGMSGLRYNAEADHRSWREMQDLFGEVFGR